MSCHLYRYFTSACAKLTFLCASIGLTGLLMAALPFMTSFPLLVLTRGLQNVALGAYITADASLIVYTMGPVRSRPFTNALHACVGVGFLIATFLVRPFLPDDGAAEKERDAVCGRANQTETVINRVIKRFQAMTTTSYKLLNIVKIYDLTGTNCRKRK